MLWFKFSWKIFRAFLCSKLLVLCLRLSKKLLGTGNSNTQRFSIGDFINGSLTWAMKNQLVQTRIPLMNCDTPHWLVVLTILKNISQWEGLSSIYGKTKNVPNRQPDHDIWSYNLRTKNQPNKTNISQLKIPFNSHVSFYDILWFIGIPWDFLPFPFEIISWQNDRMGMIEILIDINFYYSNFY